MLHKYNRLFFIALFVACLISGCGVERGPRPENFTYEPLDFTPPNAEEFRTVLSNGLVVYIAENHEIPWLDVSLMVRT